MQPSRRDDVPLTSLSPQPMHFQSVLSTVPFGRRMPRPVIFSICPEAAAGAVDVTAVTAAAAGCAAVSAACPCFCCCCGCLVAATGCLAAASVSLAVDSTAGRFCCCFCGCGDCLAAATAPGLGAGSIVSTEVRFLPRRSSSASSVGSSLMRTSDSTGADRSTSGSAGLGLSVTFWGLDQPCARM